MRYFSFFFLMLGFNSYAQTDFPALKQQFLDYRKAEKQDSALFIARKMNNLAFKEQTDTSYWYALSLRYIGNPHYTWANTDSTIYYWNKSISLFEKYNSNSPDYAAGLQNLGLIYSEKGDTASALNYLKRALEIRKKVLGEEHIDYVKSLFALGNECLNLKKLNAAEYYSKQATIIQDKISSENHPDFVPTLKLLGDVYFEQGNYTEAEKIYLRCYDIRCKKIGDEIILTELLIDLGGLYWKKGLIKTAEEYWVKARDIYKIYYGEKSADYATSLMNLGILYQENEDFIKAENHLKEALKIYEISLGTSHSYYSTCLNNLGVFYYDLGDYNEAEEYYKESLSISIKINGEDNTDVALSLNNLGNLYHLKGDYKLSEEFYQKSMKINEKVYGVLHPIYATSLNNLGALCQSIGNYKGAEQFYLKALEIRKKTLGEGHQDYASSLKQIGDIYLNLGDYILAERNYNKALEIMKNNLGEEHSKYASCLLALGNLKRYINKNEEAEKDIKKAIIIIENIFGENNQNSSYGLNNLALLYYDQKRFHDAEKILYRVLEIHKKTYNQEYLSFTLNQNIIAYIMSKTSRETESYSILNNNFKILSKKITDDFEFFNDTQKDAFWDKIIVYFDNLSSFANQVYEKVPEAAGLNYNASLVTKSKMLESKISSENYYREVDELREELAYRRRLLAKMESDGSTEKEKLEKLYHEADSLDKRLTISWPEYAQQKKNLSITWNQVQQNLENGEAAIEFVRFKNEDDSLYYYNALVLKKGDTNPTLVKLCKEKELQAISPKMGYSAYYPLVWQPLEAALKDVKTIYYAPTGELYNVPFHAMYAPKGKGDELIAAKTDKRGVVVQNERAATEQNAEYLMDRYTLHQLTSSRYLAMGLKQKAKEPIGNTMAMVGGVNYDYLPGSTAAPKKSKRDKNASRSSASASGKLNYLEGTKTEVEQVNQQVTASSWQTKLLENSEATEEHIIKLEGKEAKGILHLATHGYAFPEYDFTDTSINKNSLRYSYRYSTNPMVRSGLILAGGNWAWTGSDTLSKLGAEQNGILTALEVSQLNLKKTKLVVLSACETGLGKIEGSEGTFGLKRGFKLAGVEQMIVSLWSVPDKETMELMTLFYSDLTKTLSPVVSFSNAQKEMRNKYPTEPEKWAGFVLVR